ncbi:hypothetical protein [Butyricimonas synergistica]|uniref:hypothetical protein n=1 Tax=Butyricimonas synergistica TaxID=544644 RepID=UPI000377D5E2|nr:hypothetical protein [Butyricimonas synergistica]
MKKIISIFGFIFILIVGMGMTAFSQTTPSKVDITINVICTDGRNFDQCTTMIEVEEENEEGKKAWKEYRKKIVIGLASFSYVESVPANKRFRVVTKANRGTVRIEETTAAHVPSNVRSVSINLTFRGVTSLNFIQDIVNEHDQIRIPFRRKEDI